jgi:ankyrin repeat protein
MNSPNYYGWTLLLKAVYNNHIAMAKILLSIGRINLNFTNLGGRTALLIAV